MSYKLINLMLFVFLSIIAFGQQKTKVDLPIDSSTNLISFSSVVERPNTPKDKLFDAIRTWATTNNVISEKSIKTADQSSGEIVIEAKDQLSYLNTSFCSVKYNVIVFIKDNKYKYIIRNFIHEGCQRRIGNDVSSMKSIGQLESVLVVNDNNRGFYDHVLRLSKEQAEKVIQSLVTYVQTGKDEKSF